MIITLIPFYSVGDFKFKTPIDNYETYSFKFNKDQDNIGIDSYSLNDMGIELHVNQQTTLIEWISCFEECIFKGRNLIGMSINEFISHTDEKYYGAIDELNFEEDDIPQYVYEFENIGLQVWVKKDIVITIIASGFNEGD